MVFRDAELPCEEISYKRINIGILLNGGNTNYYSFMFCKILVLTTQTQCKFLLQISGWKLPGKWQLHYFQYWNCTKKFVYFTSFLTLTWFTQKTFHFRLVYTFSAYLMALYCSQKISLLLIDELIEFMFVSVFGMDGTWQRYTGYR